MKKIKSYEQLCLFVTGLKDSHAGKSILLYNLGSYYLAIGDAAFSLYKRFGWDFKETHGLDRENDRVFSLVSPDGFVCLRRNRIELTVRDTGFLLEAGCASVYTDTQQFLELLRSYMIGKECYTYPFVRESVTLNTEDHQRVGRLTSLIISEDAVKAEIDNKDIFDLARNMEWNFTQVSVSLMRALHNIISKQHDLMVAYVRDRDMTEKEVRRQNTFILQLTEFHKITHAGEVVLVKQRGFFIAFDDDAVIIADRLSVPLYECRTFGTRNHTAVVITANEFKALTDMDVNIHCIATECVREMYEFCLASSVILNHAYDKSITYDDVAVMKDVTGSYMVRASYCGTKFEPVNISNQNGMYLHSLPDYSLEHRRMLACIAHHAYDKQAMAIQLQQQIEENQT